MTKLPDLHISGPVMLYLAPLALGGAVMRKIEVALPEQIAHELDALKKTGWFRDDNEIIQLALMDFARLNRFALTQEIQPEDCSSRTSPNPGGGRMTLNAL
jgi:hypothetical protein